MSTENDPSMFMAVK